MTRLLPWLGNIISLPRIEASVALARIVQQGLGPVPIHHVRNSRSESLRLLEVISDGWQSGVAIELALLRLAVELEHDVGASLDVRTIGGVHDQQVAGDVAHGCLAGVGEVDLVAIVWILGHDLVDVGGEFKL
jgi:hypothetical protein